MVEKGKVSKGKAGTSDKLAADKGVPGLADKSTAGKSDKRAPGTRLADKAKAGPRIVEVGEADKDIIDKALVDKDKIDAIVSPRTDDPTANIVAGARVRQCAQCLADVFVAPSTFAFFKGKPMPPIWCVPCAMLAAETHGKSPRIGRA